jgi:chloride channel 7
VDLRPYCNVAPYVISEGASAPRAYRLFRTMGMRHLIVVNERYQISGIITR